MAGSVVEVLVGQQLEEPAEREERRPQLVRSVRHELAAGAIEARQPYAHPVEGPGELPELVLARVVHDDVEVAVRRSAPQRPRGARSAASVATPPPPPRARRRPGRPRRRSGCRAGRPRRPTGDPRAGPRAGARHCSRAGATGPPRRTPSRRVRGAPAPAGRSARPAAHTASFSTSWDSRLLESATGRSVLSPRRRKITTRAFSCSWKTSVNCWHLDASEQVLSAVPAISGAERRRLSRCRVDEPRLEPRHDGEVRDRHRNGDHDEEHQAELDAEALQRAHAVHGYRSRKRYPTPRTVKMNSGSRGSISIFSRRCRMWTSIVRGSRKSALPHRASSSGLTRVHPARMRRKRLQKLELDVGQLDADAVSLDRATRQIDRQAVVLDRLPALVDAPTAGRGEAAPARGFGTRGSRTAS